MAIVFEKKTPDWANVGAEPPDELKMEGFKAGYKPPAAYFNWFFNRIGETVKEIQKRLAEDLKGLAFKDAVTGADFKQDAVHRFVSDSEKSAWDQCVSDVAAVQGVKQVQLLASGWSSTYPYTQIVSVSGVLAESEPMLVKALTGAEPEAGVKAYHKAFGMIFAAESGDGTVTVKAYKKPAIDMTVGLKGVK